MQWLPLGLIGCCGKRWGLYKRKPLVHGKMYSAEFEYKGNQAMPEKEKQILSLPEFHKHRATLPLSELKEFCRQWRICELAFFGSILRATRWGLLAHTQMQHELAQILQRPVDLVTKRGVENSANWIIRERILENARVLFDQEEIDTAYPKCRSSDIRFH